MLRTVLDSLNLQTCQLNPSAEDAFRQGLMPIIQRVACNARVTLGVQSDQFTIELYCVDDMIAGIDEGAIGTYVTPVFFYSSAGLDQETLDLMGNASAFHWGWRREVPGTCCVTDDKLVFYDGDQPKPDLYFRYFATVPISAVCSPEQIGLLVITSMQEKPFGPDILETMQFLASVISQYMASHNRCVNEWKESQKKAAEKRKRDERKVARAAGLQGENQEDREIAENGEDE
jgi:hypothetical protein